MAIVRHMGGRKLTPEEEEAARKRIAAAARRPYIYDPDCPLLTEEQLVEFRPVHFATMEERAEAMRRAGIVVPDEYFDEEEAAPVYGEAAASPAS